MGATYPLIPLVPVYTAPSYPLVYNRKQKLAEGARPLEFGVFSFVENTPDPKTGRKISAAERLDNLLAEAELADEVGLDVFGVGEHHRPEYVASAPAVILAAIAARTKNIRLTSAVTVLSSADPVRAFQEFATLDLLSGGRAELMAGRGSFIESFPLFGYDLADYDELFAEHLDLLLRLTQKERITWSGKHRPDIEDRGVYPRPLQNPLPVWLAVGGTLGSAKRAGLLGLPLAVAIIGGYPKQFTMLMEVYRNALQQGGHGAVPVGINSHGFIARDSQDAIATAFQPFAQTMNQLGRERGWPPMGKDQFIASCALEGANFVGSPQQVVEKILYQHEIFNHDRFMLQFTVGSLPHEKVLRSIELFGTEVAPAVRRALKSKKPTT